MRLTNQLRERTPVVAALVHAIARYRPWVVAVLSAMEFATWGAAAHAAPPMTNADAFAQGNAAASTSTTYTGINTSQATNTLQTYGTTSPEASYFGGGIGDTVTPGTGKKAGCAASTPSDPAAAQECNAINYLQDLPSHTPSLGLTRSDPLLVSGKTVTNDPEALAANLGKTYAGCTATTVLDPGTTTYEVCNDYLAIGNNVCKVNRLITVAVDRTYQCIKQDMTIQPQTCNRTITAQIRTALEYYMPEQCINVYGVGCSHGEQIPAIVNNFAIAWASGYRKVFLNGSFYTTISQPFSQGGYSFVCSGDPEGGGGCGLVFNGTPPAWISLCDSFIMLFESGAQTNSGRGTNISMCGQQTCTNMIQTVTSEGIIGYACGSSAAGSTCPSGYTRRTDGGGTPYCHENAYEANAADANCTSLGSAAVSVPGTLSAREYKWACKVVTNGCTALEAKAL